MAGKGDWVGSTKWNHSIKSARTVLPWAAAALQCKSAVTLPVPQEVEILWVCMKALARKPSRIRGWRWGGVGPCEAHHYPLRQSVVCCAQKTLFARITRSGKCTSLIGNKLLGSQTETLLNLTPPITWLQCHRGGITLVRDSLTWPVPLPTPHP